MWDKVKNITNYSISIYYSTIKNHVLEKHFIIWENPQTIKN